MKVENLKHITINKQHQNLKIVYLVGQKVTKYSEGDENFVQLNKMFKQEIIIRMKTPTPTLIPQDTIIPSRLISLAGAKKSGGVVV